MASFATPARGSIESSFSLTDSLCAVARHRGSELPRDELHAALGLSFLIGATTDETIPPHVWPLLARDAFIVEGARVFGFGIRDVHPPEAAVGLDHVSAFRQHFEASYTPLIARALENNQAVLAWQGWPLEEAYQWGVIGSAGKGDSQTGIVGRPGSQLRGDETCSPEVELVGPPVQLYVIETYDPAEPTADELFRMACRHARLALENQCGDRFGVTTGPAAIDLWIDRLRRLDGGDGRFPARVADHQSCAGEFAAGFHSGIRFLKRQHDRVHAKNRKSILDLSASCHKAATALSSLSKATLSASNGDPTGLQDTLVRQLTDTRAAASDLLAVMPH
ncbi:MAG: hypothetical protein IIB57_14085 [Planctomycetes bacterium]|nr:hypothetical protein [Planctomycetota bacterium]